MHARFAMDDGLQTPEIILDEDACSAAGRAQYRAKCSCGDVGPVTDSATEALIAHSLHVETRLGPPNPGIRVALVMSVMILICLGTYAGAEIFTLAHGLTGTAAAAMRAGSCIGGFALAFIFMVSVRRFVGPTRVQPSNRSNQAKAEGV